MALEQVPDWLQALGGVGGLGLGVVQLRRRGHVRFAEMLASMTDEDADTLARRLADRPLVAQVVSDAWEAAARTAHDEKRAQLATIAAAALDDSGPVDELPYMVRTIADLEPDEVRLLTLVARPRPGTGQLSGGTVVGSMPPEEVLAAWPQAEPMLATMLATLVRHSLIVNSVAHTYDGLEGSEKWSVTPYGARLLGVLRGP